MDLAEERARNDVLRFTIPHGFRILMPPMLSHFPMQNWLKIESNKSSVVVRPVISPMA